MRMHEPLQYLPQKGIPPDARVRCCSPNCSNKFLIANGFAYPGKAAGRDQVEIFFFCEPACLLKAIPTENMARA